LITKSLIDFQKKIADRSGNKFRDPILIAKSLIDFQKKIADRSGNKFRDPILIVKSLTDFQKKIGSRSFAPSVLDLSKSVFNRGSISK